MAMVKEYIDGWKAGLVSMVHLRYGKWPEARSEEWRPIFRALVEAKATEDLADRVRDRLADNPPANFADAIVAVRAAIQAEQVSGTVVGDREQAQAASMAFSVDRETGELCPCNDCGAMGLTYYMRSDGQPFRVKTDGGLRRTVDELVMTCRCPLGRWIAAQSKCPHPDSVAYGDRVETRAAFLTRDVPDEVMETAAQRARRMLNDTFRAVG